MLQFVAVVSALSAVEAVEEKPRDTVVWIQPISGWFGRTGVGVERALGSRLSLWADVYGAYSSMTLTFADMPGYDYGAVVAAGGATLGLRFFPAAAAPSGAWAGVLVRAGYARSRANGLSYDGFVGTTALQAGWSHVFASGIAIHGAVGGTAEYFRVIGDADGAGLSFEPSVWLGVGYGF